MALSTERLRRLSDQTARESGLVIDDSQQYDLSRLYVPRDIEPDIIRQVRASPGCIVLTGEAGSGKTSLLWHIHQRLQDTNPAIFLRAEFAADHEPDELLRALDQLRSVKGRPILLIDTADAVVGTPRRRTALLEVIDGASTLGCAIVVSSRPQEAARYLPEYHKTPIPDRYSEREFAQIVETHARHFYGGQSDLEPISKRVADILAIVSQGQPVADLATRPLLLRMLFSLYAPYEIPSDINTARLYETYWDRRVCTDWRAGRPEPERDAGDHSQSALAIAYRMLLDGMLRLTRQQVRGVLTDVNRPRTDIEQLVSRGVLRRVSAENEADSIDFFHQTFFEYAAARSLIAHHGAVGVDLLADRLRTHVDDHLRLPVLEHVLVLSQSSEARVGIKGRELVEQILKDGPTHLQRAAVTAYAQMPSAPQRLRDLFRACMKDRELVVSFVRATPSIPLTRWDEVWDCFRQIWDASTVKSKDRRPWVARRAVLEQLPRLALRDEQSASDVTAFLEDYRVIESIELDTVENVVRILIALAGRKPRESLGLLEKLLRRMNSEFAKYENAPLPVVLAIARHPNAKPDFLQTIINRPSTSNNDYTKRVRGVVQAGLWHQNQQNVQDILRTITSSCGVGELSALAAWLSDQLEEVWDQVWNYFVLHSETIAGREWVPYVWDRLGLQPIDKGDIPSVRGSRYLTVRTSAGIRGISPAERRASLLLCRYSASFELRVAILQAVLESSGTPSPEALCASDDLGLLLGPAITVTVPGALGTIQHRSHLPAETQLRLIDDVDSIIRRAPEYANDIVLFLIYSGEFPKIEFAIKNDDLKLRALPSDAASSLSAAIMDMLQSRKKRQQGARLAFYGTRRALGVTLEFDKVVEVIASEADERVLGWLAMAVCELAETSTQVNEALKWGFLAAEGDEYVRDKAFEALLDLVITWRLGDCLDSVLAAAERPTFNLRRILAVVGAVPRIAVFDRRGAARLAHRALTLPSLQKSGIPVLGSLRNQGKKPLIQWSQQADVEDLLALVAAIPSLTERVGLFILDVVYRPPHADALRDAISRLSHDPNVSAEVKHHIPVIFRKQSDVKYSNRWDELLAATLEEGEARDAQTLRVVVALHDDKMIDRDKLRDLWVRAFGGAFSSIKTSSGALIFTWSGMDSMKLIAESEQGLLDKQVRDCGGDAVLEILNSEGECLYQFVPETHFTISTRIEAVGKSSMQQAASDVDILLLSVTEVERDAILDVMRPWPGTDVILEGALSDTTYRFGRFGRYLAAHVESTMSTQGRHGATLKASAALLELKPKAMLLLGIAFGVDRKKQRLGDVIVAETVQPYDYERVGVHRVIPRGIEKQCGMDLSERFRTRRRGWKVLCGQRNISVFQGQMLSGPKLVDSKEFRDELVSKYPNAQGGEMEGAGGYDAAEQARIQTMLIKSICDWADGHKNDRAQSFAAFTAVSLAEHVLNQPDVLAVLGARDVGSMSERGATDADEFPTYNTVQEQNSKKNSENTREGV